MIKKIILNNIMSWEGENTIEYKNGIILLNGKYGAGKSSLLVDGLDIVFSNKARSMVSKVITKGKQFGSITLFIEVEGIEYKIYWFHQPKSEENIEGKNGELKVKKIAAKNEWKTFQIDKNGIESEINKTPEEILGIPYEIAKKTFIIGQHELASFSEAGPSEKYDIIADAFGISTLFKIGEKSNEKIKEKNLEKTLLLKNLDGVNTSDFETLPEIKKELEIKKEKVENLSNLYLSLLSEKEKITIQKNDIYQINQIKNSINSNQLVLNEILKNVDFKKEDDEIKILEEELKNHDISKIEKEEEILSNLQRSKILVESNLKQKIDTYLKNGNEKIELIKNQILSISSKFQSFTIQNAEYFSPEKRIEISNYLPISELQSQLNLKTNLINEKKSKINNLSFINKTKNDEKLKNEQILTNLKNIKNSNCPTCYRPINENDYLVIEKNFLIINSKIDSEKLENEKIINQLSTEISSTETSMNELLKMISDIDTYHKILEKEQLSKEGKELQLKYNEIKKELENGLATLNAEFISEIQKYSSDISIQENKINELKKNNKYYEFSEKLKSAKNKIYSILGTYYSLQDLKILKSSKEQIISNNIEQLNQLESKYQNQITFEQISTDIEQIIIKISQIQNEKELNQNEYIELKSKYEKLEIVKIEYEKVKEKLDVINKKIEHLEKISFIFGKKGEPKNIIEKIIIPQLEEKTNSILTQMTNGNYSIEFSLSSITEDGKESKKNIFDIIVYQNGVDQTYDLLSGGERTNVNFAIRLGITECLNDLLGRKVNDFLILDETFNAVDAEEGGEELIKGLLQIYNSDRFKQIFIITHVPYIKDRLSDVATILNIEKRGKYSYLV